MKKVITLNYLGQLCSDNNWRLIPYSKASNLIEKYRLGSFASNHRAFTFYYNERHYILYRDDLKPNQKLFSVCHEIGHIELHHTLVSNIYGCVDNEEIAADDFANEMLSINKKYSTVALIVMPVILLLIIGLIIVSTTHRQSDQNVHTTTEIVYITPTGTKYHNKNCYHIQNSNLIEISIEDAIKSYDPCKTCRSDDNYNNNSD